MLKMRLYASFNRLFTGPDNTVLYYYTDTTSEKHWSDALQ